VNLIQLWSIKVIYNMKNRMNQQFQYSFQFDSISQRFRILLPHCTPSDPKFRKIELTVIGFNVYACHITCSFMASFDTSVAIRCSSDSVVDSLFVLSSRDNQFTEFVRRFIDR
jgi:hypothetical protein